MDSLGGDAIVVVSASGNGVPAVIDKFNTETLHILMLCITLIAN